MTPEVHACSFDHGSPTFAPDPAEYFCLCIVAFQNLSRAEQAPA